MTNRGTAPDDARDEPIVGAVPLAILTWWSIATPILAVLGLLLGWPHPPFMKGAR